MILKLFCITLIVVFVIDHSGMIDTIKGALAKWLKVREVRIKPFDCSLCMSWWCGLLALAIERQFTLGNIVAVALFALFADKIADTLTLLRDATSKAINAIYKLLKL
jgi:hypothetical protein